MCTLRNPPEAHHTRIHLSTGHCILLAPCGSPLQNRNPVRTNERPGVLECAVTRRDQVDERLIFLLFKTANLINICIIHKCGEQQVHSLQMKRAAKMTVYICVS